MLTRREKTAYNALRFVLKEAGLSDVPSVVEVFDDDLIVALALIDRLTTTTPSAPRQEEGEARLMKATACHVLQHVDGGGHFKPFDMCGACAEAWPCTIAQLRDALKAALEPSAPEQEEGDKGALIAEARKRHTKIDTTMGAHSDDCEDDETCMCGPDYECDDCCQSWPCLTIRLADALSSSQQPTGSDEDTKDRARLDQIDALLAHTSAADLMSDIGDHYYAACAYDPRPVGIRNGIDRMLAAEGAARTAHQEATEAPSDGKTETVGKAIDLMAALKSCLKAETARTDIEGA